MAPSARAAHRPRRSALYLPATNERALAKAKTLGVDTVIFDCEDSVAPDAKESARRRACLAVKDSGYGQRELTIRINGVGTPWHDDDLREAAAAGPDAIVVPKVSSAAEVCRLVEAMEAAGAPGSTALWAVIETPRAVLHAEEIAAASPRLAVLVMGTNDLANELHAEHVPGREPLLSSLCLCLLAARSAGTAILDGVFNDVGNAEGFEAECFQGRRLGFDGKTLIHPGQVEPCNRVFAPSEAEVEEALAVLRVWEDAVASGRGVATVNGRMIENLHVENARRLLDLKEAIEGLDGTDRQ
jgi:citrate lyase subunit beta/citryl-CoA lyase